MKWFGKSWGSQVYEDFEQTETPVGQPCVCCEETIVEGDDGFLVPCVYGGMHRTREKAERAIADIVHAYESGELVPELVPMHRACHLRSSVIQGLNHQLKLCACYGGTLPPDPPEMTLRRQAEAAVEHWMKTEVRPRAS